MTNSLFPALLLAPALSQQGLFMGACKLAFYLTGTTTLATVYDAGGHPISQAANGAGVVGVAADGFGRFPSIYLDDAVTYRAILRTAAGVQIGAEIDPLVPSGKTTAKLARSTGAGLVGFSQDEGYASGTIGLHNQSFVSITDAPFNAKCDGTTDDHTAIMAALNSGAKVVYANVDTFKSNGTIIPPAGVSFVGAGNTSWIVGANVVGARVLSYSKLQGFKFQFPGGHTQNGVEAGDLTNFADRAVLQDLFITGAGNDGLQIRNGNCGSIRDVTSLNNGRDGINFTKETNDNNAWKLEGRIDLRANTRDGLHLEMGSSASDPLAPKSNSADLVTTQNNGRYGLYCGTRSNSFVIYSEANTTADIFLDTYAYGNALTVVEAGAMTNNGQGNFITTHNADADYKRQFVGTVMLDGSYGTGGLSINNNSTVGKLRFLHTAAAQFAMQLDGSGADQVIVFENIAQDGSGVKQWECNHTVKGDLVLARQVNETHGTCVIQARVYMGSGNKFIAYGTGDPSGQLTADPGSMFHSDTGNWAKKQGTGGGTSGWVNLTP